ncbi:MAG: spore germination protein GerPE [Bacillus sp. (in: firmicutes)]
MSPRTVRIKQLNVNVIISGSVFQVGDSSYMDSSNRALALQVDENTFHNFPEDFNQYPRFTETLPVPVIYESLPFYKEDLLPDIRVNCVQVSSIAASSIVSTGNTLHARMCSKVVHVRKLTKPEEQLYAQIQEGG